MTKKRTLLQKYYCNRLMIPEEEKGSYLIPKSTKSLFQVPTDQFSQVHPYCLGISAALAKYLPIEKQMVLTDEQILNMSNLALAEFSDEFFTTKMQYAKETRDRSYPVTQVCRYSDGTSEEETIETTLLDKLRVVNAIRITQKESLKKKAKVREKAKEKEWQATDQIPLRYLADILDMSTKTAKKLFSDIILTEPKNTVSYSKVLDQLAENTILPEKMDNRIEKELSDYLSIKDGKVEYHELPLLYQQKVLYDGLGFIFQKVPSDLSGVVHDLCKKEGFMVHFPTLKDLGYRYIAGDVELLKEKEDITSRITTIFEEYGLSFDKEKHKLPY